MTQSTASTLAQVSAKAGCSPATVSRVLNNSGPVSRDVRKNVLKAVQESGYIPRRTPRGFRLNETLNMDRPENQHGLYEVILYRYSDTEQISAQNGRLQLGPSGKFSNDDLLSKSQSLTGDFYMHIISGVMDELACNSRRAMLQTSDDLLSPTILRAISQSDIGGVILLGEYADLLDQFMDHCTKPLVLIDIIHPGQADIITIDNLSGISQAMEHLFELGHRKIGYVGAPYNKSYEERWGAWQWMMAAAGLHVNKQWVYHGSHKIQDTSDGVREILKKADRPTAFVCASDWSALGVLRSAEQAQLSVPHQLSVIGFDDINAAAMVTPPLTTLHVPLREMGQHAARQILMSHYLNRPAFDTGVTMRLTPQLIIRNSTAGLSTAN